MGCFPRIEYQLIELTELTELIKLIKLIELIKPHIYALVQNS